VVWATQTPPETFFHTPLVYLFVFGSFFYHDYVWWPLKGRRIQRRISTETKWGRLFAQNRKPVRNGG
jgi:hypothetical protein